MEQMPSREAVSRQIGRILASPDFDASPKQVALLEFIVDQTLAGRSGQIDDATLAAEVFGRGADYDRRVGPIISYPAGLQAPAAECPFFSCATAAWCA